MIQRPDLCLERYTPFATTITTHVEASHDVADTLARIRATGRRAGLAVSPPTPIDRIVPYLGQFDLLLVITVNPGFGGQPFIPEMMDKVRFGAELRETRGLDYDIEVDGGINISTAASSIGAGANVLVAGTSVFRSTDRAAEIAALRGGA